MYVIFPPKSVTVTIQSFWNGCNICSIYMEDVICTGIWAICGLWSEVSAKTNTKATHTDVERHQEGGAGRRANHREEGKSPDSLST